MPSPNDFLEMLKSSPNFFNPVQEMPALFKAKRLSDNIAFDVTPVTAQQATMFKRMTFYLEVDEQLTTDALQSEIQYEAQKLADRIREAVEAEVAKIIGDEIYRKQYGFNSTGLMP
jgi:hypothetical protein